MADFFKYIEAKTELVSVIADLMLRKAQIKSKQPESEKIAELHKLIEYLSNVELVFVALQTEVYDLRKETFAKSTEILKLEKETRELKTDVELLKEGL